MIDFQGLSEEALARLFQGTSSGSHEKTLQQEKAFEEIYRRFWLQLLQVAWQKTGNREASEELVQELFVRLWERRDEVQIESLRHYLFRAIRYRIINYIQAEMHVRNSLKAIGETVPAGDYGIDNYLNLKELVRNLKHSIDYLPEKSRIIFELSRSQHFSNKQIAGQLNISEKTVEYHISKSLKLLRVYLKDFVTLLAITIVLS